MRTAKIMMMSACAAVLLGGCDREMSERDKTPPPRTTQPVRGNVEHLADGAVSRDRGERASPSAVEDALEWSRKYSETAEELVAAQRARHELEREKQQLLANVARLQTELDRAKQELRESNQMLIEMREELDRWKANVLGYRDEMRQAQEVQLDRLAEIIKLLGGQVGPVPSETAVDTEDAREGRERESAS